MQAANDKIKVLQVIHGLRPGGAEKVVIDLATRCDRNVIDMEVCCINHTGPLADELERAGIPVLMPRYPGKRSYLGTSRALRRLIEERAPDVVHSHGDVALFDLGPAYALSKPAPLIHTYHFGNYPHIRKRHLYAQAFYARFADQLVAVSDHQRQAVIKHMFVPPARIHTVLNGVADRPDLSQPERVAAKRAELGLAPDDIALGCVAVLTEQKGVTYLLQAARKLLPRDPRLKLLIVGGGRLFEPLQQEAAELGLGEHVIFTGWREDVREILPALDIFVMPSLWEAMSIVLLEAMAAGCPIVATDVGDNAKFVHDGETGLIIPPRQPNALVEAVAKLVEDPQRRARFGEAARAHYLAELTLENMIRHYERLYRRIGRGDHAQPAMEPAPGGEAG